jgi:hypothetical protein
VRHSGSQRAGRLLRGAGEPGWRAPSPDHGRLVGALVVRREMDIHLRRHVGFDGAQELQELSAAVSTGQLTDDLAGGDVQR